MASYNNPHQKYGGAMSGFRTIILLLLMITIAAVGAAQTGAAQNGTQQSLQDKLNIQALIVRYGTALDTLDADAYAGVFTTDAELDVAGICGKDDSRSGRSSPVFSGAAMKTRLKELPRPLSITSSATRPSISLTTKRRATVRTGRRFASVRTTRSLSALSANTKM